MVQASHGGKQLYVTASIDGAYDGRRKNCTSGFILQASSKCVSPAWFFPDLKTSCILAAWTRVALATFERGMLE